MITDYCFTKPTIYSPGESITFTFTAFTSSIADVIIITSFWSSFHQTYHLFTRSDNHFHFLSWSMSPVATNINYKWPFSSFVIINKVTAVLIVLQFAETQILDFSPNFHRTSFPHKSLREVGNVVNLTENSCRSQILCQFPRLPAASPTLRINQPNINFVEPNKYDRSIRGIYIFWHCQALQICCYSLSKWTTVTQNKRAQHHFKNSLTMGWTYRCPHSWVIPYQKWA